jgi:RNA polymerase sigma factor (sigma-70 family)
MSASPVANDDLLRRCGCGDDEAWQSLVSKYERLVYSIALREGLDPDDAADVTQEVFAALLSAVETIDQPDRLGSWLMTVTRRMTWRRRSNRRATAELDGVLATLDDPNDELVRAVWLYEAVSALGEPCSSIIVALFLDPAEPSYAEIALRLGRPIGSLGPTRARCLERLRLCLEEDAA